MGTAQWHVVTINMELSFASRRLRSECHDPATGDAAYGPVDAAGLRARLADLDAAVTVADLPTGSPRCSGRELRVSVTEDRDLVCEAHGSHVGDPPDWRRVYRLRVLRIEERR